MNTIPEIILSELRPKSKILILGMYIGNIVKVIKENLQCEIFLVEKDYELGKANSFYCVDSLIGSTLGNVERYDWVSIWSNHKFDYIILADTLSNVDDPEKLLNSCRLLLKDNGSIYISTINIGGNQIIIDLLANNFNIKQKNLYTYNSLLELLQKSNLFIEKELNIINNSYQKNGLDIPYDMMLYLNDRPYGSTHQFIWELKQ